MGDNRQSDHFWQPQCWGRRSKFVRLLCHWTFCKYDLLCPGVRHNSFFDKFDCSGKTLIPFSTHGGSGWSGTLEDIRELVPDATMVDGYSISRNNTATSRDGILNWLREIGMTE
ncbi:flavodoxin [Alistipes indistinctus]|uniref:flavodoxin n=1 Tax=Alistipes indistinctus TaxID=626932 RepID=UPI003F0F95E7